MFGTDQLKAVMDSVRLDAALVPKREQSGVLTTYCNLNAYRVVQALGLNLFYNYPQDRPMLANEMVDIMVRRPQAFSRFKDHIIAFELTNTGILIMAASKGEAHGHIAPLYPSAGMETSGKWLTQVPRCSNVGVRNDVMGVNYAFADPPDYFIVL